MLTLLDGGVNCLEDEEWHTNVLLLGLTRRCGQSTIFQHLKAAEDEYRTFLAAQTTPCTTEAAKVPTPDEEGYTTFALSLSIYVWLYLTKKHACAFVFVAGREELLTARDVGPTLETAGQGNVGMGLSSLQAGEHERYAHLVRQNTITCVQMLITICRGPGPPLEPPLGPPFSV